MNILSDLHKRILKEEYPNMSLESDPDVEQYFNLRSMGRQSDALKIYNLRIKQKYPDSDKRTRLMSLYRSRNSEYKELLAESLVSLAERLLERTKKIILILTRDIETLNIKDAYAVIKLAEGLLSIISPDRFESIAFTEKYVRYAKILDFQHAQMERTAELIRLYVTDNLIILHELRKEKELTKKIKQNKDKSGRESQPSIDLSKIIFSQADISLITIPSGISKTEDVVIAYCLKYWNLIRNPAFEKTILLYSRKYKTNHYEIFQAIKNGREHGWKDEEILNSVLSNVVTGYYYNISGDLYLQRTWALYKDSTHDNTIQQTNSTNLHNKRNVIKEKKLNKNKISLIKHKATEKNSIPSFQKTIHSKIIEIPKQPDRSLSAPNSIADIIRKKTGKTYTVYKELFFRKIRPSIRSILATVAIKKGTLFGGRQNDAEEIIYNFLFEHYSDPYQNWKDSNDRKLVEKLGYHLPELEPVIEGWIHETANS